MLPILYQSPEFILYSYPLLMGIGWGVAYQVFFSLTHLSRLKAQLLFWGIFLSAWVGAKLLFYFTFNGKEDFFGELSFWTGGGFVFYGGLLAGILFIGLFKAFDKQLTFKELWALLPALCLGHAIGRVGCLLAGCCFGKPTDFFWGIWLHDHYRHPTQLIEAFTLGILGLYLLKSRQPKIVLISTYFIVYGLERFIDEMLRGDLVRGQWGIMTPSQWISVALLSAGIILRFRHLQRS